VILSFGLQPTKKKEKGERHIFRVKPREPNIPILVIYSNSPNTLYDSHAVRDTTKDGVFFVQEGSWG